jgi:predicted DNA-binding transcriptional regulator AlpA
MKNLPDIAACASKKMATGVLMRIAEVGSMLDVAPATVHALPLKSIRIGRSLRYDPADVRQFIESCKEPVLATERA